MTILVLVFAAMVLIGWLSLRPGSTAPFTDVSGKPLADSIAVLIRSLLQPNAPFVIIDRSVKWAP